MERFIDLLQLRPLLGRAVAAQLAGAAVVSGIGRPRKVAARLFDLVFFHRKAGQVIEGNLRAGIAVVIDVGS